MKGSLVLVLALVACEALNEEVSFQRFKRSAARGPSLGRDATGTRTIFSTSDAGTVTLPSGHAFCDGSDTFYCPIEDECRLDESGTFRCYSGRPGVVQYRLTQYHAPDTTRDFVPVGPTYREIYKYQSKIPIGPSYHQRQDLLYPSQRVDSSYRRVLHRDEERNSSKPTSTSYRRVQHPYPFWDQRFPCADGYRRFSNTRGCMDVDECADDDTVCKGENEQCRNQPGSYQCLCKLGYVRDGEQCVDIDQCAAGDVCNGPFERCRNVPGLYYCSCARGYFRRNDECVDYDECRIRRICVNGNCMNTPGSFSCVCRSGYRETIRYPGRIERVYCEDIDECASNPCRDDQICFNTWGSYSCDVPRRCPEGYVKKSESTANVEVCVLVNPGRQTSPPNEISYRKMTVPTKTAADRTHPLGRVDFENPDHRYLHSYDVEVLEGTENFRVSARRYGTSRDLQIRFYNRGPLVVGEELPLKLKVTDRPRPKSSQYRYNPSTGRYTRPAPLPKTHRIVYMTLVPGVPGQ